ncbi:MAG: hypothetical protein ORN26_01235 [Candidatus Pacebacteria bacterium]|nr:hypothetical protein [Candidatus Paceibacterota bacterium]
MLSLILVITISSSMLSFATGSVSITTITDGKDNAGANIGTSISKNTSPSITVSCTNGDKLTIVDNNDIAKSSEVTCASGTATLTPTSALIDGTYKIKAGNTSITALTNGIAAVNTPAAQAIILINGHTYTAATAGSQAFFGTPFNTPTPLNISSTISGKSCRTYVATGTDIYVQADGLGVPVLNESYAAGSYAVSS